MRIWLPEVKHILRLHEKIVEQTGGASGVREIGLVESALARASAAFGGVEAYSGVTAKAAAVGCGLTQNHGFVDGNKRIGITAMLLVLYRNGVALRYTQEELVHLGLAIAQGDMDVPEVAAWIELHIQ